MVPIANSVFLRLAAVLLALGVGFNIFVTSAVLAPAGRERSRLAALPAPEQAAAIVEVLERTAHGDRSRVLSAVNSTALRVTLVSSPPSREVRHGSPADSLSLTLFNDYEAVFGDRDLHVDLRPRPFGERLIERRDVARWAPARLYVRLYDGEWVVLEPTRGAALDNLITRGLAFGGFGGVIVLIGLWLAVRQTTRPIAELSDNVEAFAENLEAPPLAERGSKEVRALARSFNTMKLRIRTLVGERTRVLAAIAHDLRTYLTRLHLRIEYIADADQRSRAELDLLEMNALLDDTLALARAEHDGAVLGATDVAEQIRAYVATAQEVSQPITMADDLAAGSTTMAPLMVKRVLANLADNAVRYGGSGHISLRRESDLLVLSVEDEGPGIPEADLDRVISPFERLEPSRARAFGGAGLGLSIVRALLEAHGGTLTLTNKSLRGLRAEASMPLTRESD